MNSNNLSRSKKSRKAQQTSANRDVAGSLIAIVLALTTFMVFLLGLSNQFVNWDDYETLVDNPHYRGFGWSQLRWMFTTFHMGHYQPLSWLTFASDYWLWGMNPLGCHLTNLLLHSANPAVFFFLLNCCSPTRSGYQTVKPRFILI